MGQRRTGTHPARAQVVVKADGYGWIKPIFSDPSFSTPDEESTTIAEVLAERLAGSILVEQRANKVRLSELGLTIQVGRPWRHWLSVGCPIGIGDPEWGDVAWAEATNSSRDGDPADEIVAYWTRYVLPPFVALRAPDHPLAAEVARHIQGSAEILAGPILTKKARWMPDQFDEDLAVYPPTMVVAEWVLAKQELPDRPLWLHTRCEQLGGDQTLAVVVNNADVTEDFPGFANCLAWEHYDATVKSWAVLRRLPD